VICPLCRAPVPVAELGDLIRGRQITGHAEAILRTVWVARGLGVSSWALFDAMYADDEDGGPSVTTMYLELRRAVQSLAVSLAGSGVAVRRHKTSASASLRWCIRICEAARWTGGGVPYRQRHREPNCGRKCGLETHQSP